MEPWSTAEAADAKDKASPDEGRMSIGPTSWARAGLAVAVAGHDDAVLEARPCPGPSHPSPASSLAVAPRWRSSRALRSLRLAAYCLLLAGLRLAAYC